MVRKANGSDLHSLCGSDPMVDSNGAEFLDHCLIFLKHLHSDLKSLSLPLDGNVLPLVTFIT